MLLRRVDQHGEHDRRRAKMRHLVLGDQPKNLAGVDGRQTDVPSADRCDGPGIRPAVAMEHRQRPQIHGLRPQSEGDDVAERVQIGAAVMVERALRIAGGARRVVEGDRLPFLLRIAPPEVARPGKEFLVVDGAQFL
jgi:hypothetical protein